MGKGRWAMVLAVVVVLVAVVCSGGCGGPSQEANSSRGAVSASDPSVQAAASDLTSRLRELTAERDAIALRFYGKSYEVLNHEQRMRVDEERRAPSGDRKEPAPQSGSEFTISPSRPVLKNDVRGAVVALGMDPNRFVVANPAASRPDLSQSEKRRIIASELYARSFSSLDGDAQALVDAVIGWFDWPRSVREQRDSDAADSRDRVIFAEPSVPASGAARPPQPAEDPPRLVLKGTITGGSPLAILERRWSYDGGSINMRVGDKCEGADGQTWTLVAIKEREVTFRSPRGTRHSISTQ